MEAAGDQPEPAHDGKPKGSKNKRDQQKNAEPEPARKRRKAKKAN